MRINLYISKNNYGSRRNADKLIKDKKVYVNGNLLTELGYIVKPGDKIVINNQVLKDPTNNYVYYLLNKPKNYLCTNKDTKGRKIYLDLIKDQDKNNKHLFTIGRLDKDTTGALLITNDGDIYNQLIHPRSHVAKEYIAIAYKELTLLQLQLFKKGLTLKNNQKTQPCSIKYINRIYNKQISKWLYVYQIILHEGKKNQIHLSFKVFNITLFSLERTKFANLNLTNLKVGNYRSLTNNEINQLKNFKKIF